MYYAALLAKPLKSSFPAWLTAAHLDIGLSPHFCEGHPRYFFSFTFVDDKSSQKLTFALHGHGTSIDDPTITYIYTYIPVVAGDKNLGLGLGVLGVSCILGVVTTYYLLFIQIHSLHPDLQVLDKCTSLPIVVILILRQIMITVL